MAARAFVLDISRTEHQTVGIAATDRDAAVAEAQRLHPGFTVDGMAELGPDGEQVAEHTPIARCEGCRRVIWEGDSYAVDEEGCYACAACMPTDAPSERDGDRA